MSDATISAADVSESPPVAEGRLVRWGRWLDARLVAWGDLLAPILVKEARQSLKSWQFLLTFGLLLVGCWVLTFLIIFAIGDRIYYDPSGKSLFVAYYICFVIATHLFVPFTTYRSLAAEREDGTYELVSITTLSAFQIVLGKLSSALLQVLLYFSVLVPCMVFTYLLQGIDLLTMGYLVALALYTSLCLTVLSLLAASLTKQRSWGILLSLVLLLVLLGSTWGMCVLGFTSTANEPPPLTEFPFWVINAFGLMQSACLLMLLFQLSAALLNFASANNSTAMRVTMVVSQSVFTGWMTYCAYSNLFGDDPGVLIGQIVSFLICSVGFWLLMGMFLTSESSWISPRVRRTLPQTFFTEVFLMALAPGPGKGLLLAVGQITTVSLLALAAAYLLVEPLRGSFDAAFVERFWLMVLLMWGYCVAYLSVGHIITQWARGFESLRRLPAFLVTFLIILLPPIAALLLDYSLNFRGPSQYWLLHVVNPIWTLVEVVGPNRPHLAAMPAPALIATVLVPATGVLSFVVSWVCVIPELRQARLPTPKRVEEEERELHPPPPEPPRQPTSPWDEPATT